MSNWMTKDEDNDSDVLYSKVYNRIVWIVPSHGRLVHCTPRLDPETQVQP